MANGVTHRAVLFGSIALASFASFASAPAAAQSFYDALTQGRPLLDVRLRYDSLDESDKPKHAWATTIRARAGYETGYYEGFALLGEFDLLQHFGPKRFNDAIDGFTSYPVIADPDLVTVNRLELEYRTRLFAPAEAPPDTRIAAGRQEIILGDLRFIGNSGWRQHEQTFDAVTLANTSVGGLSFLYAYVNRVNRPVGPHSPAGHFDSDSHFFDAVYTGVPHIRAEGFLFLFDFKQAPTLSTANYGFRLGGTFDAGSGLSLNFDTAMARQTDRANNPLQIDLLNYRGEGGFSYSGFSAVAGYEVLQGNGTIGFQTPLGTGHLFQGWAETFTVKPAEGVEDFYVKTSYGFAGPLGVRIVPQLIYHDFSAEHVRADYGSEWDAGLEAQIDAHLTLDLDYADYAGAGPFPDKREFWAIATYHL